MPEPSRDWSRWYEDHAPALLLYARQWLSAQADAEDAVHDGFVSFWRRRAEAEDPLAYLYACVRSAALDRCRTAARRSRRELTVVEEAGREPLLDTALVEQERGETVAASLRTLPPEQREVVVMKIWGGLTFQQIGAATGVSPNTAASRYRLALETLRQGLSEEMWR